MAKENTREIGIFCALLDNCAMSSIVYSRLFEDSRLMVKMICKYDIQVQSIGCKEPLQ